MTITIDENQFRQQQAVHGDYHGAGDEGRYGLITCPYCGKRIPKMVHNQKFCDRSCKDAYHRVRKDLAEKVFELDRRLKRLEDYIGLGDTRR